MTPDEKPEVTIVGGEALNEKAVAYIDSILGVDETLVAVSGFDFATKVLVITDQRVLVSGEENETGVLFLSVNHDDISLVTRDGRTLIIKTSKPEKLRYRFGTDQTVEELVEMARTEQQSQIQSEDGGAPSIAERVRFWEEQDKINQELIPRVIRQHELLTAHIADHENLPLVAGNAISEALAEAREEQQHRYDAALEAAKQEQQQQFDAMLEAAKQEQQQRYEAALEIAKQEQQQQYDAALDSAKAAINNEAQANLDRAVATLNQEWRETRNILIGIIAVSGAIAIASIVAGIVI